VRPLPCVSPPIRLKIGDGMRVRRMVGAGGTIAAEVLYDG